MFGFFSDVKNRLLAAEQKIEVIWQHLFNKDVEEVIHAEQDTETSTNDVTVNAVQEPTAEQAVVPEQPTEG